MTYELVDLYLAFRQAKVALFYQRHEIGLLEVARYEQDLESNLTRLRQMLSVNGGWFDDISIGQVFVVPKRFRTVESERQEVRIGVAPRGVQHRPLEIQLRLAPSADFAIVETLYLWRFGPLIDGLLTSSAIGNRLDTRDHQLSQTRRWLFQYWPPRYQEFRNFPIGTARRVLLDADAFATIVSVDLASYYDTIASNFLLSESFISTLSSFADERFLEFDQEEYRIATSSLNQAYRRYQQSARFLVGGSWKTGIPIGALTSPVVANAALTTLDRRILANPSTVSYRRYVDDIVIVAKDPQLKDLDTTQVLRHFVPVGNETDGRLTLNCDLLDRPESDFEIQQSKIRIHHLSGQPGIQFLKSIREDFRRLVSERRAFLDPSLILEDVAAHVTRANKIDESPLRVLRDADRIRLEHYALSTSLVSLDRISALVDREEAVQLARGVQVQIRRVLDGDEDWVSNLDLAFRLLRLAITTDDIDSLHEFVNRMDQSWGSVDSLKVGIHSLVHRGVEISRAAAWIALRNYLQERRVEAFSAAVRPDQHNFIESTLAEGLTLRGRRLGWRAILRRARLLAVADLRARDREDDDFPQASGERINHVWMLNILQERPDLRTRTDLIRQFVERCTRLGDRAWIVPAARLFLCTRPPSYFDIARRWLYRVENGFQTETFQELLEIVNAVRGTEYSEPVGCVIDPATVLIPSDLPDHTTYPFSIPPMSNPRIILGNLVSTDDYWGGASTRIPGSPYGRPVLSLKRLRDLTNVIDQATRAARHRDNPRKLAPPALLVLPELSLPRKWFRTLANHLVKSTKLGLVVGLEYLHQPRSPHVINQVFGVFPGPFNSVATWPWTKRLPAREEARLLLGASPPLSFHPHTKRHKPRTVVRSMYGDLSVLICSELIEVQRTADLLRRAEIVLAPSWNTDTHSYDHLIQSAGIQLSAIIAIANNGYYSDCRAWAPLKDRWLRDLCRLITPRQNGIVSVEPPLNELRRFRKGDKIEAANWKPLPPDW